MPKSLSPRCNKQYMWKLRYKRTYFPLSLAVIISIYPKLRDSSTPLHGDLLYRISPKATKKWEKCAYKFTDFPKWSLTVTEPIWTKLRCAPVLTTNCYTEFHEEPTNSSVTDTRSQKGWRSLHKSHSFFHLVITASFI